MVVLHGRLSNTVHTLNSEERRVVYKIKLNLNIVRKLQSVESQFFNFAWNGNGLENFGRQVQNIEEKLWKTGSKY